MQYLGIELFLSDKPVSDIHWLLWKNEFWKDIKGYEGQYQISTYGNVKSLSRWIIHGTSISGFKLSKERLLRKCLGKNGYYVVNLCKDSIAKVRTCHWLVAHTFLHPVEFKADVNHKNTIRVDNYFMNLELVTHRANTTHGFKAIGGFSSEYVGVSYVKKRNKWAASLQLDGKHKFLGHFLTEIEAANAYRSFIDENNIINSYA